MIVVNLSFMKYKTIFVVSEYVTNRTTVKSRTLTRRVANEGTREPREPGPLRQKVKPFHSKCFYSYHPKQVVEKGRLSEKSRLKTLYKNVL